MRRATAAVLGATALALPNVNAWAAATTQKTTAEDEGRHGDEVLHGSPERRRPVGRPAGHDRRQEDDDDESHDEEEVRQAEDHRRDGARLPGPHRSLVFINQQALPILIQETIQAQSSAIDMVSGATDTSRGVPAVSAVGDPQGEGLVRGRRPARERASTRVEQIMGMPIVVDVRDVDDAAALDPLFDWFRFVDRTFSTYIPDSEISRLNRGELALADAHPDVREVLARCEELRARDERLLRRARRARRPGRPVRARQGLVGRPRGRHRRRARLAQLRDQRRRRHPPPGWRPPRAGVARRDPAPGRRGADRRGRRRRRPRRRDVGRLRARQPRLSTPTRTARRRGCCR